MSILLVAVILILAGFALHGYIKGIVRVVFSLISIFLTIGMVTWMTPYVSEFLQTKTPVYRNIQEKCIESVRVKSKQKVEEKVEEQIPAQIAGIEIPKEWQEKLEGLTEGTADEILEQSGVYEEMGSRMANTIVNIIACIISLLIVIIVLRILVIMLDIVARLPVLKSLNRLGGLAAGAVEGIIVVWILFFVITLCQTSDLGRQLLNDINGNCFLKILYENNIVEYLMLRVIL